MANMNTACSGGSSRVFKKALAASWVRQCAESTIKTFFSAWKLLRKRKGRAGLDRSASHDAMRSEDEGARSRTVCDGRKKHYAG